MEIKKYPETNKKKTTHSNPKYIGNKKSSVKREVSDHKFVPQEIRKTATEMCSKLWELREYCSIS